MNKKDLGAFYTPSHTADYMVSKFTNFDKKSNLLEPSGGDGVFVSAVLNTKKIAPSQITVWDINPETKNNILSLGVINVEIKDTLLETEIRDTLLFNKKTFSNIIGNPPYLNKQSSYIKNNKLKLRKKFDLIGVNDTYAMFLYLGCKSLTENGQLCFIVSNTFLTLGTHKKLRKFLLESYTIKEITLCPKDLFKDTGALVNTCIIYLQNKKSSKSDYIIFNDCTNNKIADYSGKKYKILQQDFLNYPDNVFAYKGNTELLKKINKFKKLIDFLDGGLGMHTTDNHKYLGVVDYNGKQYADSGFSKISVKEIDGKKWKFYHKKGGNNKYFMPVEHCIRWDVNSVSSYKNFKTINLNEKRQGFIISGISSKLAVRLATKGALWNSNKAFCFFPKESSKLSAEFFVGILNSKVYNDIAKLLNHTVSLQIRDIKKLPLPEFNKEDIKKIEYISKHIIKQMKINYEYNFNEDQEKINLIVSKYI